MVNFYFWPVKHSNSDSIRRRRYLVFAFLLVMAVQILDLHRLSHWMGEDEIFSEVPCDLCLSTVENEMLFLTTDVMDIPMIPVDHTEITIGITYNPPILRPPFFFGKRCNRPPPLVKSVT